jgi:hypothetical protein
MHQTQAFVIRLTTGISPSRISGFTFNLITSSTLTDCLTNDAVNYIYSAAISIADAINGLRHGLVSWATVKLYYSTFYACRGILALHNVGVFYVGTKPFVVEARVGNTISRRDGQTHKIILDEFRSRRVVHSLLSQDIELKSPLDWLIEKREIANYKNLRFWEPEVPDHFRRILDTGVRRSINAYIIDVDTYAFDPEHAILAYPIKILKTAYDLMTASGKTWDIADRKYVSSLFRDEKGPITEIYKMFHQNK